MNLWSFQSKVLRSILNAPWYVSNYTTRNDLNVPTVFEAIKSKFHPNPLAQSLSSIDHPLNPPHRLRRQWPGVLLLWVLCEWRNFVSIMSGSFHKPFQVILRVPSICQKNTWINKFWVFRFVSARCTPRPICMKIFNSLALLEVP